MDTRTLAVTPDIHPMDVLLESTTGRDRTLRSHHGRVAIAFWEGRDHLEDNAALKSALREHPAVLCGAVVLVAIADLRSFDFPAARTIARTAIGVIASRHELEVLFDWKGVFTQPPFSFQHGASHIAVIDARGSVRALHGGVLGPSQRARFIASLDALVSERPRSPSEHAASL